MDALKTCDWSFLKAYGLLHPMVLSDISSLSLVEAQPLAAKVLLVFGLLGVARAAFVTLSALSQTLIVPGISVRYNSSV